MLFQQTSGFFFVCKFLTLYKSYIENYNKTREAFDCAYIFPQILKLASENSFDLKKGHHFQD